MFSLCHNFLTNIMEKWFVYIIRTKLGTLYTGSTNDVERRFVEHVSQGSKAAKYLLGKGPLELVYVKEVNNRSEACVVEAKIKKLKKIEKIKLISGFNK